MGLGDESEPARFLRDSVRRYAVELDNDVLGLELAGGAYDRAAPVDRGAAVIPYDSEQLARVAHAEDVANRGRRWHVVIRVEAVHGVGDRGD